MIVVEADRDVVPCYRWIHARSEVKRGVLPMSEEKENPADRVSAPAKSSEEEPGYVKPAAQKTAEEQFIEHVQGLLDTVDPSHFNDTWEGCTGDPAT